MAKRGYRKRRLWFSPAGGAVVLAPATIRLTPEIQKALEGAECYQIRFYMGNDPVVLEAAPKQLAALRQFLRTGRP